jgi:hypothetical protein
MMLVWFVVMNQQEQLNMLGIVVLPGNQQQGLAPLAKTYADLQ